MSQCVTAHHWQRARKDQIARPESVVLLQQDNVVVPATAVSCSRELIAMCSAAGRNSGFIEQRPARWNGF
jgi:hypothetical protein